MSCGIYKLIFSGTDKIYIGQSQNIPKRYLEHIRSLKSGKASKKLQEAYDTYGMPEIGCILNCSAEELDYLEDTAINTYDSCTNGFNSLESSLDMPKADNAGDKHGLSKYSNDKIIEVFNLLIDRPELTYLMVSKATGVSTNTISHISQGSRHTWLKNTYPDRYRILMNLKYTRNSAKHLGTVYPPITSPTGVTYTVESPTVFAKQHKLNTSALIQVLKGRSKHTFGWKILCQDASQ